MQSSHFSLNWPSLKAALYRKKHIVIAVLIAVLITTSINTDTTKKLSDFPNALVGTWVYETGDENSDGCKTSYITVREAMIIFIEDCIDEGRSSRRNRVKDVLAVRAFYSDEIKEYHVLTDDGPNVVFDLFDRSNSARIYLQFWITNDYGPTISLGVFNQTH